jgi:hypothetical protein
MALPRDELVASLEVYRQGLAARVESVNAARDRQGGEALPLLVEALFDYTVSMCRAERDWVAGLIERVGQDGGAS